MQTKSVTMYIVASSMEIAYRKGFFGTEFSRTIYEEGGGGTTRQRSQIQKVCSMLAAHHLGDEVA